MTLVSMARVQSSGEVLARFPKRVSRAATLTRASSPPKRSAAAAIRASQLPGSRMSVAHATTRSPDGSSSLAMDSSFSALRAPTTTFAPSRRATWATSRPSPSPTPATAITFPSSIAFFSLILLSSWISGCAFQSGVLGSKKYFSLRRPRRALRRAGLKPKPLRRSCRRNSHWPGRP